MSVNNNATSINHVLDRTLSFYQFRLRSGVIDGVEVDLYTKVAHKIYPYSQNPMSNILLKIKGLDNGSIDPQFFADCLRDIQAVGRETAQDRLVCRLVHHHYVGKLSVNEFFEKHKIVIVYTIPNKVHITNMPYQAKPMGMSKLTFRQLLNLAILEMTYTAASSLYVLEGKRPQDLLDKAVNP